MPRRQRRRPCATRGACLRVEQQRRLAWRTGRRDEIRERVVQGDDQACRAERRPLSPTIGALRASSWSPSPSTLTSAQWKSRPSPTAWYHPD